jgi:hypothetical protein
MAGISNPRRLNGKIDEHPVLAQKQNPPVCYRLHRQNVTSFLNRKAVVLV